MMKAGFVVAVTLSVVLGSASVSAAQAACLCRFCNGIIGDEYPGL